MTRIIGSPASKPASLSAVAKLAAAPHPKQHGFYTVDVRVIVEANSPAAAAMAVQARIEEGSK